MRLSSPLVKAGIVALEIAGVLLAVAAGIAAFVFWRLQTGPLSLGHFKHTAEFAIETALPAQHDARIAEAWLERGDEKGEILLVLSDVSVTANNDENNIAV